MSWDDTGTRPENPAKRLILLLSRLLTLPEFLSSRFKCLPVPLGIKGSVLKSPPLLTHSK